MSAVWASRVISADARKSLRKRQLYVEADYRRGNGDDDPWSRFHRRGNNDFAGPPRKKSLF